MIRAATRLFAPVRGFSTVAKYYQEHYEYPGNPDYHEFLKVMTPERKPLPQDKTVFKPTKQIEFNRTGEVVLYTSLPYRTKDIIFPYPYCLAYTAIPAMLYMFFINPLHLMWYWNNLFIIGTCCSFIPHGEYLYGLRFYINRLSLLRGGTVLAVEHSNV